MPRLTPIKPKLNAPQEKILKLLTNVVSPISRATIAEELGYSSSVAVYRNIGWPDKETREKYDQTATPKSLIGQGLLLEVICDIEGKKESGVLLSPAGKEVVKLL